MQNLSGLAADSMWVTSQEGGNMIFDNSGAMTAPGTDPVTPVPKEVSAHPDPHVTAIGKPRSVLVPDGPRGRPPGQVPWTAADGSPWKSSANDEYLPRMKLARGQWNEV